MKKTWILLVMLFCFMFTGSAFAMDSVTVSVDNQTVKFTDQAAVYNSEKDLVLIPLRAVCEAIGAEVTWDAANQKALIKFMNKTAEVPLNTSQITVNQKTINLKADTTIMNNRTMVPLDFISQALGSKITWDKEQKLVSISDRNVKVKMASTIGPIDAGIVGTLAERFEAKTGINVEFLGAGTGKALEMSKTGDFDLVMVHAKVLEEQFVADGYGTERIPVMYNDFVIIGPANDPAGIKGMSITDALKTIMDKQVKFISRGDKSGTHVKEEEVWEMAGIKPEGEWYVVWEGGPKGNSATLRYTNEQQAYTLIDRATYLSLKKEITLIPLVEGDESLLNFISVIPVNPERFSQVNHGLAMDFINYMTSEEGQIIIRDFKQDVYGEPLFFPNSNEWKKLGK